MSLKQKIRDRITWLNDKADGGTPPYADLRVEELESVMKWLDEVTQQIKKERESNVEMLRNPEPKSERPNLVLNVRIEMLRWVLGLLDGEKKS